MRCIEVAKKSDKEEKLEKELEKLPNYIRSIGIGGQILTNRLELLDYTMKLAQLLLNRYKILKEENERLNSILTKLGAKSLIEVAKIIYDNKRVDIAYIMENTRFTKPTVYNSLKKLLDAKLIARKARGVYGLPDEYGNYTWEEYKSLVLALVR